MYLRDPEDAAIKKRVSRTAVNFLRDLQDKPPKSKKALDGMYQKYNKVLDGLGERADDALVKRQIRGAKASAKSDQMVISVAFVDDKTVSKDKLKQIVEQAKAARPLARVPAESPSGWENKLRFLSWYQGLSSPQKTVFNKELRGDAVEVYNKIFDGVMKQPEQFEKKALKIMDDMALLPAERKAKLAEIRDDRDRYYKTLAKLNLGE